jgi:hypothetical protein
MRAEVVKYLPPTIGDGALDQFHETKAVVFIRVTDVRAQLHGAAGDDNPLWRDAVDGESAGLR